MRKALLTLATVLVLAGLFAGSWFVTGMLRGETETPVTSPVQTSPMDGSDVVGEETTEATSVTVPAAYGQVVFDLADNLVELNISLGYIMRQFGANEIAVSRMTTYAGVAYFDTFNPKGLRSFIASETAAQGDEQGMLAAGAVISRLLANPEVTKLIDAWEGELTAESAKVVDEIVAFALNDGYEATAGAEAPKYEGDLAWQPGGSRHGTPAGYEPAYGAVRPILLNLEACPVAAAPMERIAAERQALDGVDTSVPAPAIARIDRFSMLTYAYARAVSNPSSASPLRSTQGYGQIGFVMLHDALIATWRANWANGVIAPGDIFAEGDPLLMSSYPSYPAWAEVAAAATERYLSVVTGKAATFEEIVTLAVESMDDKLYGDQLKALLEDVRNARSTSHHWSADIEAGRELGICLANEALKTLGL